MEFVCGKQEMGVPGWSREGINKGTGSYVSGPRPVLTLPKL